MKTSQKNYFKRIKSIGFENLPNPIKQAHLVIMSQTDMGKKWDNYEDSSDFKEMVDTAFDRLDTFMGKSLDGVSKNPYRDITVEIGFIRRFLAFHDKVIYKKTFEIFIDQLHDAISKKKIRKTSPVAKEITYIQEASVTAFNKMQNAQHFELTEFTRKKLMKILEAFENAYDDLDKNYLKSKKQNKTLEGTQTSHILPSESFTKLKFDTLGFKGKWLELIGDPSQGFTAMVYGKPKMGKSYLCMDLAGYLARNHGTVLYVAKEEKLDATLQKKVEDTKVAHHNLFLSDHLPDDLSMYAYVILDSVNKLGYKPKDLDILKSKNKGTSFIFVFQTTKDGNFRGGNEFQHDVDVVIEIPMKGRAVQYGRFNQGGVMEIFSESPSNSIEDVLRVPNSDVTLAGKDKKMSYPKWTKPDHLNEPDHKDLAYVFELYKEGKLNDTYKIASNLDTIVRDEIPNNIWTEIGGKLLNPEAKAKEYISSQEKILKKMDNENDDLNPQYLFSTISPKLLAAVLSSNLDLKYLIKKELVKQGLNLKGKWIGFDKAEKENFK